MHFSLNFFRPLRLLLCGHKLPILDKGVASHLVRFGIGTKNRYACAHNMVLKNGFILQIFYEGLEQSSKMTIDAAAGGNLMNMGARDEYKLIDDMALSQQQWSSVRGNTRAVPKILETDLAVKVAVQVEAN
jgi:hypothetical protein